VNVRFIPSLAILAAMLAAPAVMAQSDPPDLKPIVRALPLESMPPPPNPAAPAHPIEPDPLPQKSKSPVNFSKTRFILLSSAVYAASIADMHQTLEVRKNPWWYETDPLAKPFARLPAPAYYAAGLAVSTGLNWLSWKMAHSRRWHKLAPVPQLLSIGGNLYGFHSNNS
jgi:hypothetical protein